MTLVEIDEARAPAAGADPNLLQRRAADPTASVWVGASAGTGKTKVLTDRVLRLMLAGTDPARVLCLTFTKAAAAEMSVRLADKLAGWAVAEDAALRDHLRDLTGNAPTEDDVTAARRLFARVLDAPGGMKIQTIHAFCQSLLRRFPLEAGLAPNFEVMDDRTAAELLAEARQSVLGAARDGAGTPLADAVAFLAGTLSEDEFTQLLSELTVERGRIRRILDRLGGLDAAVAEVHRFLGVRPGATPEEVIARACADGAFDDAGLRAACRTMASSNATDIKNGQAIQSWLDRAQGRVRGWNEYLKVFLTTKMERRDKLIGKAAGEGDPAALRALERECARILAVLEEMRCVTVARATAALLTLAEAMLDAYRTLKDRRAVLDFDDLILTAARLMAGKPDACAWVLFKLDGGLDHVLIDEAQDTNPDQWAVVKALAEEFFSGRGAVERVRTVFVVGDDKQSIFSFQRADPAEFARMRTHFAARVTAAEARWEGVDLRISFRSVAAVLQAVDEVFRLPEARDGVALPDADIQHVPYRRGMAGRVELWPLVSPAEAATLENWSPPVEAEPAEKPMSRLASVIADRIDRWLRDGEMLEARGRAMRPGDVMVLVRRRNAFVQHLVRALKDRDVPVAGVDRMVLTEQLAVMDLLALARFLLLPEDDLTLATVLKSPLVGLTEEQLFQAAWDRPGHLWPALAARAGAADADPALRRARDWLEDLQSRTDFRAPFELFAGVLTRPCPADPDAAAGGSGRRAILARLGAEAIDPLDEFMSAALAFEREHVPSLQGFLHWLESARTEIKRELDGGKGPAGGRVRIMTVHGSKGLQAPVVIMPDTMGVPDKSPRVLWPDADDGDGDAGRGIPLYAPRAAMETVACRAAKAEANRRRDQEYRRLLYVALTRAEDRLIVCGWEGGKAASGEPWYRLTERALANVAAEQDFDFRGISPRDGWQGPGFVLDDPQRGPPKAESEDAEPPPPDVSIPEWARAPAPDEPSPSRPLTPSRPSGVEPAARSPLGPDDGHRFKRGTLIHKLLQVLPDLPEATREAAARGWLARPGHGLTAAQVDEIAGETLRILRDPAFAPLFGPGSRAEVPVVGLVGPEGDQRALSGQIDRLLVTDDAVWIVDYKTNRPPPTREEDVSPVYVAQMAAYRAVLRRIYPGRAVRCILLWTDGPHAMELSAARLDAAAPE